MSAFDLQQPLSPWDPSQYDLGKVFDPAPLGDIASPNDTSKSTIMDGIKSIGSKTIDFFSKTADLFATGLGYYAQGKQAYDVITNPSTPKPAQPVANSQLPSLQGTQNTSAMYDNFLKLRQVLNQIVTPKQSDAVNNVGPYTLPPVLVAGAIVVILILLLRTKNA